jgi:hypothetical protein
MAFRPNQTRRNQEPMLSLTGMDALLLKFGLISSMPWPELIQVTGVMATFKLFIDLAMKLIFGK